MRNKKRRIIQRLRQMRSVQPNRYVGSYGPEETADGPEETAAKERIKSRKRKSAKKAETAETKEEK